MRNFLTSLFKIRGLQIPALTVIFFAVGLTKLSAVVPSPYTVPVSFSVQVTGYGIGGISLTGEPGSSTDATAYNNTVESAITTAYVRPGQSYPLNFGYSGPSSYAASFIVPEGYAAYIDGQQSDMLQEVVGGGEGNRPHTFELRPISSLIRADAGVFSGISVGKSVSWDIGMGGLRTGRSAGRIYFREFDLSSSPDSRGKLYYTPPANNSQFTTFNDGPASAYRLQIMAPQVFVDLVDDPSGGYWLKFYAPSQAYSSGGLYTVTGSPWKTIRVESPGTNQLKITETQGSTVRISQLSLTSGSVASGAYVWTLQEGNASGWLRTTTHTSTLVSGGREDLVEVRTGNTSGTVVARTKYCYADQGWGEELVQTITDPTGSALTTTMVYYTNSSEYGNYRRVKTVTGPTASWTGYHYYDDWNRRGQLQAQYSPWVNAPSTAVNSGTSGRVVTQDYGMDWTGRYRNLVSQVEQVNGQTTGQMSATYDNTWGSGEPYWEKSSTSYYASTSVAQNTYTMVMRGDVDPDEVGLPKLVKRTNHTQTAWVHARGNWSGGVFTQSSSGTHWREVAISGSSDNITAEQQYYYDSQWYNPVYLIADHSTATVTIHDAAGKIVHTEDQLYRTGNNWTTLTTQDFTYDATGQLTQSVASNNTTTSQSYTDGRLSSAVDASGSETQFTYDGLGRVLSTIKKGVSASGSYAAQDDITTTNTYDGASRVTQAQTTATGQTLTATSAYDLSGRVTSATQPGSYTTTMAYTSGGLITTATLPGGATQITETYLDGRVKSLGGTGQTGVYWTYDVQSGTGYKWSQRTVGGVATAWQNTYYDWLGQKVEAWQPGWGGAYNVASIWTYSDRGQLTKSERTGFGATYYGYDPMAHLSYEWSDMNNNATLDYNGPDRIKTYSWSYYYNSTDNGWEYQQLEIAYAQSGVFSGTLTRKVDQRVSGFATNRVAQTREYDVFGNSALSYTTVDRTNKLVTGTTQLPTSSVTAQQIAYNGLVMESRDMANVTSTYQYDTLGRAVKSRNPRTGTDAETAYITGTNLVSWVKDTAGNAQAVYGYDAAGRVGSVRDVYGRYAYTAYNDRGQVAQQWGETVQPVSYSYDSTGRMAAMSTYRGGSGWTGSSWPGSPGTADTTTWSYDAYSGMLAQKTDAASRPVNFTYNNAGMVATRQWARGVTATYSYDPGSEELTSVAYSDGTPGMSYAYNRIGQVTSVTDNYDGAASATYEYDSYLQPKTEKLSSFLGNRWLTYNYQNGSGGTVLGRPTGFSVGISSNLTQDVSTAYGYDTYGRTNSVTATHATIGSRTFNYGYAANSSLVSGIADAGGTGYAQVRSYESNRDLLNGVTTSFGATLKTGYAYTYNEQGQRVTALQSGGSGTAFADLGDSYYRYAYDARGQLTSAYDYLGSTVGSTSAPMPGRLYDFGYDQAGNRSLANTTSVPGMATAYTANALNQLSQREVHYTTASGTADSAAKIAINGLLAGRQGNYWSSEVMLDNTTGPVYATMAAKAVKTGSPAAKNTSNVLGIYLAKTPEVFTYDYDGNLTGDGRWTYTWDAENRLKSMETSTAAMATSVTRKKLEFRYDSQGRRIMKRSYYWSSGSSTWVPDTTTAATGEHRFVYQGWNLASELDGSGNLLRSYAWGLDIAGSMSATGGIGAMVQMVDHTGTATAYLPGYDAQGNLTALMKTDGSFAAAYEYSPFGELLRKEGAYAATNSLRNATKYTDEETGLVYYGHRYYSSSLGRFINRDPSEESGGVNLYGFCGNNGINSYDYLGLDPSDDYNRLMSMSQEDRDYAMWSSGYWLQMKPDNVGTSGTPLATEGDMMGAMQSAFAQSYANHLENSIRAAMQDAANSKDMAEFTRLDNLAVELVGSSLRANGGGSGAGAGGGARAGHYDEASDKWVNPDGSTASFSTSAGEAHVIDYYNNSTGEWTNWYTNVSNNAILAGVNQAMNSGMLLASNGSVNGQPTPINNAGNEKSFLDINYAKAGVAMLNGLNASRLFASGVAKLGIGEIATDTGIGAAPGVGVMALGFWNLKSSDAAYRRGLLQVRQAVHERASDASWRNLLGIAPFGQNFDDPWEPTPKQFVVQKIEHLKENPSVEKTIEFFKEIGSWGL